METEKRKPGRPKGTDSAFDTRFTIKMPEEFRLIIDNYKNPVESYVDFVKKCIIYTCSALDIKADKRLKKLLDNTEKADLNKMADIITDLKNSIL